MQDWRRAQENELVNWQHFFKEKPVKGVNIKDFRKFILQINQVLEEKNLKVLDIGSGPFGISTEIAATYSTKDHNVCAIDPLMNFYNNFELDKRVIHLAGVGESLPFKNGSFDLVISTDCIDHVKDPSFFLSEIHRILKPGGFFYLTLNCFGVPMKILRPLLKKIIQYDPLHPYTFGYWDIENLIGANYTLISTRSRLFEEKMAFTSNPVKLVARHLIHFETLNNLSGHFGFLAKK